MGKSQSCRYINPAPWTTLNEENYNETPTPTHLLQKLPKSHYIHENIRKKVLLKFKIHSFFSNF